MKRKNVADRLDAALCSEDFTEPELAGLVRAARQLESLKPVPPLSEQEKFNARQAFLAQAALMREAEPPQITGDDNVTVWDHIAQVFQPRTRRALVPGTALLALVMIVALVLGVGLLNLNRLSQESLPGDRYYSFKIFKEDLRASITFNPYKRVNLFIDLIEARNQEIAQMILSGRTVPPETASRYEDLFKTALNEASKLPDHQMALELHQISQMGYTTGINLSALSDSIQDSATKTALENASQTAFNNGAIAEQGLRDTNSFRALMAADYDPSNPTPTLKSTATAKVVIQPPTDPTPVVVNPQPTVGIFNPPIVQPSPTRTPLQPIQPPVQPSATPTDKPTAVPTPTATDPPPVLPSPTEIIVAPTQVPPTSTPTPTSTKEPENSGPLLPTPTPITNEGGGE